MATGEELARLRRMADLRMDDTTYTDDVLVGILDGHDSFEAAAAQIWTEKAATFATAVDMSESGSSRSLSQLHKNALAMKDHFQAAIPDPTPVGGSTYTVQIERL